MSAERLVSSQRGDSGSVGTSSINAREVGVQSVGSVNSVVTDYDIGDWLAGMEMSGRISPARRFFALFITFDVLLCTILWLVCVVLSGKNVFDDIKEQIINYSVETSTFDVVVCSLIRFLLLILVYVILRIDHWWMVAIVTSLSSIGCLLKILYFKWQSSTTPTTFQVTLIVSFFILGWLEIWLFDHRVIAQEARARHILQNRYGSIYNASAPLVDPQANQRVRDYLSTCTGSVANFYSPMGSPPDSDDEDEPSDQRGRHRQLNPDQVVLRLKAEENCRQALDFLNSTDWKQEENFGEQDVLFSRREGKHTLFMFTCTVACPTDVFASEVIHNCGHCPEWNSAVQLCRQLEQVDGQCEVRYQQTGPLAGGVVSPRDFINLRLHGQKGLMYFSAAVSVEHRDDPREPSFVRAIVRPTIITVRPCVQRPRHCVVEWILNTDCCVGAMVPKRIMDRGTRQAARQLHSDLQALGRRLASAQV